MESIRKENIMKLNDIIKATAFTIVKGVEIILTNPKIKTIPRKKKHILDLWNSRIEKAIDMATGDYNKMCLYAYYGMVTYKTMEKLSLDEIIVYIAAILKQMTEINKGDWNESE